MAVAKTSKPQVLEDKIRESQTTDPRFSFLNDEDPYYNYYKWKVEYTREEMEDQAKGLSTNGTPAGAATPAPAAAAPVHPELVGYEPKQWEFKVDLPGVTAQDLDILRLTALFHARRGRSFLSALSVREGRNYQFDFLRPTHSLYGYYNRMVESYQKVMTPAPGQIEDIIRTDADPEAKWKTLAESRKRALWEEGQRARDNVKKAEQKEEEEALAVIDWQDFVTVETIDFTQADMELDLPPPSSNDKLKEMSMAERRMAAMIMEEPAAPAEAGGDEMELEEDEEDEEARIERVKAEREQQRTRDVQRAALEKKGVKIKKDYVPKGESPHIDIADIRYPAWRTCRARQVPVLWAVHSRGRALRAHPYRAAGPKVEGPEARARGTPATTAAIAGRRGHFNVAAQSRCGAYGFVRRRGGRGDAQAARGGRQAEAQGARENCVGRPHCVGVTNKRHVPGEVQGRGPAPQGAGGGWNHGHAGEHCRSTSWAGNQSNQGPNSATNAGDWRERERCSYLVRRGRGGNDEPAACGHARRTLCPYDWRDPPRARLCRRRPRSEARTRRQAPRRPALLRNRLDELAP